MARLKQYLHMDKQVRLWSSCHVHRTPVTDYILQLSLTTFLLSTTQRRCLSIPMEVRKFAAVKHSSCCGEHTELE